MKKNSSPDKKYEFVIIGHSLGALQFTQQLRQRGHHFCILDSALSSNQPFKDFLNDSETHYYVEPPFVPQHTTTQAALENLGIQEITAFPAPPLHFNQGKFSSFLGFGDKKIAEAELYYPLCSQENLYIAHQPETLGHILQEQLEPHLFLDQTPTEITFENKQVTSITTNGKSVIHGQQFVFFRHFHWVLNKMAEIEPKMATKMRKLKWFTSINIAFHHPELPSEIDLGQPYLLMGSKGQPCQGLFSQFSEGSYLSRWQTFLSHEQSHDSEVTGAAVKEIKKQFKRAFPTLWTPAPREQIVIYDKSRSNLEAFGNKINYFSNLHLISSQTLGHLSWLDDWDLAQKWTLNSEEIFPIPTAESCPPA